MHELALSQQIVRTAVRASGVPKDRIVAVAVEVGALSSVSVSALEFCLRSVLDQNGMHRTQPQITWAPARVRCECGHCYDTEDLFAPCPRCGDYAREVIKGSDVVIQHVEVEDGED